jgi:hypothetical protein
MSLYDDTKDDENPAYALRGHDYHQCCMSPKEVGHKFTCINHPRMKDNSFVQVPITLPVRPPKGDFNVPNTTKDIVEASAQDNINHPKHYVTDKVEVIDVIEAFELDFHLGSVLKYVLRHNRKGKPLEDLRKAAWFLARKIKKLEEKEKLTPTKDPCYHSPFPPPAA